MIEIGSRCFLSNGINAAAFRADAACVIPRANSRRTYRFIRIAPPAFQIERSSSYCVFCEPILSSSYIDVNSKSTPVKNIAYCPVFTGNIWRK